MTVAQEIIMIVRKVLRNQVFFSADNLPMRASLALPNGQRSAPIPLAGKSPVLNLAQPLSKPAFFQMSWHPINQFIILNQSAFNLLHIDKPTLFGVIQKCRTASPAKRIIMFV